MEDNTKKPFFMPDGDSIHLEILLKDRVKILLRRKGMSQNELAENCGISNATMSHIMNKKWVPTSKVMLKISRVLECDSVVLFGDTDYWKDWRKKMLYLEVEE